MNEFRRVLGFLVMVAAAALTFGAIGKVIAG